MLSNTDFQDTGLVWINRVQHLICSIHYLLHFIILLSCTNLCTNKESIIMMMHSTRVRPATPPPSPSARREIHRNKFVAGLCRVASYWPMRNAQRLSRSYGIDIKLFLISSIRLLIEKCGDLLNLCFTNKPTRPRILNWLV